MPVIEIPEVLRRYSGGAGELRVQGSTAREALGALPAALRERILDARGRLRPYLLLYVAKERVADLELALEPDSRLEILAAAGGG